MKNLNAEQIRKELEGLAKLNVCPQYIRDALALIKELTEKNKKLSAQNYMICPDGTIAMIPTVKSVRTDTVQEVIASIDEMFRRQRYESMWIDKNGEVLGYFDVGDAQECWDGYIKPEIERMPPADAVEVRHGHWKYLGLDAICSECGYINKADVVTRCRTDPRYCPKCGAKMDGAKCENSEREGKK